MRPALRNVALCSAIALVIMPRLALADESANPFSLGLYLGGGSPPMFSDVGRLGGEGDRGSISGLEAYQYSLAAMLEGS